jgi:ATP adenylyltransferase/5',5'''-P-1,P-4-tetraphosphate phosphorylase II
LRRLENIERGTDGSPSQQVNDYNFVLTKNWMMLVLRKQPHLNDIHCNSLGYLGLLFVKD